MTQSQGVSWAIFSAIGAMVVIGFFPFNVLVVGVTAFVLGAIWSRAVDPFIK